MIITPWFNAEAEIAAKPHVKDMRLREDGD
jgi:hypothetical protein